MPITTSTAGGQYLIINAASQLQLLRHEGDAISSAEVKFTYSIFTHYLWLLLIVIILKCAQTGTLLH